MLHVTLTSHLAWIVGTVEDGGELVVMSFVVPSVLAALLARAVDDPRTEPVVAATVSDRVHD